MSRWLDYRVPFLLACLVAFLAFKYIPVSESEDDYQKFMSAFVEFGSLCFGVLLTFFGIVIQSSSDTVRQMKRKAKRFNRFVLYNRNIIMFSLALTVYAYIFGNLDFWKESSYLSRMVIPVFCGAITYFIYGLFYLLVIFFLLLRQHEN